MKKKKRYKYKLIHFFPVITLLFVSSMFSFSSYYTPKWLFTWEGIRKEVKDSVQKFDKYGEICFDSTNQFGYRLQNYFTHQWILKNATPNELFDLLDYPDGTVKAIAYEGLMYNPKVKKYPLFKRSLNDTLSFVFFNSGCEDTGVMLSDYVINFISDIDKSIPPRYDYNPPKIELSIEEKEEILNLFYKRKAKESYYKKEFYNTLN